MRRLLNYAYQCERATVTRNAVVTVVLIVRTQLLNVWQSADQYVGKF